MPLFYFHFEGGATTLDTDGIEFCDVAAARDEAAAFVGDVLRDNEGLEALWTGKPMQLRVTDEPAGAGETLCVIEVTATCRR